MILPRFSIRELLGFVAFLAVGTTALLYASPAWSAFLGTCSLGLLFVSVLIVVLSGSERRAFWLGVAIFGWLYVIVVNWPGQTGAIHPLPTALPLKFVWEEVLPRCRTVPTINIGMGGGIPGLDTATGTYPYLLDFDSDDHYGFATEYPNPRDFRQTGHWIWTLLIVYVGGRLGRYFYMTRSRDDGQT